MFIRQAASRSVPVHDRCAIAVMAKASSPGRTKTRLVPPLTFEEAADLNTAFLKDVADNLAQAGRRTAIDGYMAFGPPGSASFFEDNLPGDIGLMESWFPDFGQCLLYALSSLLGHGYGSACVLNADSPTLPTEFLVAAADALARPGDRMVLGPSNDGGYYLLGLKQEHRRLFEDIAWSTEHVDRQTRERAAELGLETIVLPEWYDVDDRASLTRLADEAVFARPPPSDHVLHTAAHSAAELRRLFATSDAGQRLGLEATR